jgi:hypothetical protein
MSIVREDERKAAVSKLSSAAKDAMSKWKEEQGIKAIIRKTQNQKVGLAISRTRIRKLDAYETRKASFGPASEVRIIKSEKPE